LVTKEEDKSVIDDEIKIEEVAHQGEDVLGVGVTPSVDQF